MKYWPIEMMRAEGENVTWLYVIIDYCIILLLTLLLVLLLLGIVIDDIIRMMLLCIIEGGIV